MSIQIKSTNETEYRRFLSALKQAVLLLDVLGQIQATVGGLSMDSRANTTFEIEATLENYVKQIEYNNSEAK